MQLNFIQSNWHRQYPFRALHGDVDLYKNQMPTDLIVALRLTCESADLETYISKVSTNSNIVSISFAGARGPLGYANGKVTSSNFSLSIKDYSGGTIGTVTVGNQASTSNKQYFEFDNTNGMLEPTTVLVMAPPGVTSLNIKNHRLVGGISLTSKTLGMVVDTGIHLSTLFPSSIASRDDKSAETLTCDNAIISGINTVKPDRNGNIDIFAIAPLAVTTGIDTIQLSSPGLGLHQLCKIFNIPPDDPTQVSHQPIATITEPEWKSWPQFNP